MSYFADKTVTEWIGFISMFFFGGVLIWSLIRSHRRPPPSQP